MQTKRATEVVRDYLSRAFPATWANQHQMVSEVQLAKEASVALAPQLQALTEKIAASPMNEQQLATAIHNILSSTTSESTIANAITRGIGSMAGSAIISAIFESIRSPFRIGSDVASSINDIGGALDHASGAVDKFADATTKIDASVAGIHNTLASDVARLQSSMDRNSMEARHHQDENEAARAEALDALLGRLQSMDATSKSNMDTQRQFERSQHDDTRTYINAALSQKQANVISALDQTNAATNAAIQRAAPLPQLGTHREFFDRLGRKRKTGLPVEFGDHSVTMIFVTEEWAVQQELAAMAPTPTLWQDAIQQRSWANVVTTNNNHDIIINLTNVWYNADSTEAHRVDFDNTVVNGMVKAVAAHHVIFPTVTMAQGVVVGMAEDVSVAEVTIGGQINDRQVQNTLHGKLHAANASLLKDLAYKLGDKLLFYDNTYMYAKLAHYVLTNDFFSQANVAVNGLDWDANIHWLNLDEANLNYQLIVTEMEQGSIFFIENFDWQNTGEDAIQLLYLLSSGQHRLQCQDAATHGSPPDIINGSS